MHGEYEQYYIPNISELCRLSGLEEKSISLQDEYRSLLYFDVGAEYLE